MAKTNFKLITDVKTLDVNNYNGIVAIVNLKALTGDKPKTTLPKELIKAFSDFRATQKESLEANTIYTFDLRPGFSVKALALEATGSYDVFEVLTQFRKVFSGFSATNDNNLLCIIEDSLPEQGTIIDAVVSAYSTCFDYQAPKFLKKQPKKQTASRLSLVTSESDASKIANHAFAQASATNLARYLCALPGNKKMPKSYIDEIKGKIAGKGLKTKFYSIANLEKMGAGAFTAVAQGSDHRDSGILRLDYVASGGARGKKTLALVGKGVVYDTGGVNVKPAKYMFGMQGDMAGSAVALGVLLVACEENWPVNVTAYLAISDNAISAKAYRPNDVVRSLSGLTIETVHTDAEGRMMLADTLTLADQQSPDLIIDFATLTGSCVAALGCNYSGAFCRPQKLNELVIQSSHLSGERVWPFPLSEDYAEVLKSDVADVKQCNLNPGPDHIEAAMFLKKFFDSKRPWVHIDLSSSEREGGLGHVPTKETGFGVRFTTALVARYFNF